MDNESKKCPKYVVGIGASAGGLEALNSFFSHLDSTTGAAFIVVQHLSPSFKSMMDQLLRKQTSMSVKIAEHQESVQANHVYLIPPSHDLTIMNGVLHIKKVEVRESLHLPIDKLFISLAKDYGAGAIAVILSGTGSDGNRGISRFKELGGLVVVQDPSEAEFDGMPNSAIRTKLVDVMLPVAEIPEQLVNYMKHPFVGENNERTFRQHISQKTDFIEKILSALNDYNGFDFREYKSSTIARRIERRMGITNISDLEDYYSLIEKSEDEISILSQEILIGVTEFFREPRIFEYIADKIFPKIIEGKDEDECIRIWVTACSTGEEAYSLAILCSDVLESMNRNNPLQIFATDIDSRAIAIASKGQYTISSLSGISSERRSKYFNIQGSEFTVKNKLRKLVVFAEHNLIKDPPFSNMDMTSCRNLLIYLQNSAQERALSFAHFSLRANGYLFLGISETLGNLEAYFKVIDAKKKIYQKVHDVRIPVSRFAPRSHKITVNKMQSKNLSVAQPFHSQSKTQTESTSYLEFLLARCAPPSVVVNRDSEIVYISGDIEVFTRALSAGQFRGTLDDILLNEISVSVSTALYRVKKEDRDIYYRAVNFYVADKQMQVNIRAFKVDENIFSEIPLYVVSFEDLKNHDGQPGKNDLNYSSELSSDMLAHISQLEEELAESRNLLRETVEQLETTNEELQSSNEELMAANEEMQSTNEELQSVNEELYTVNQEYQEKINELTDAYTDLNNLFNSTSLGVVFLDKNFCIRRFTPESQSYFSFKELDIGRPISDFTTYIDIPDFEYHYNKVMELAEEYSSNLETKKGKKIRLKILPYFNDDGFVDGAVLVFSDFIA